MVNCLERGADCLHMVQLLPVHPKIPASLASFKFRLVPAYPGCFGKEAINNNNNNNDRLTAFDPGQPG